MVHYNSLFGSMRFYKIQCYFFWLTVLEVKVNEMLICYYASFLILIFDLQDSGE